MLAETTIELEARIPIANRLRRWSIELGQDLLGMWIVDIEFGRIGSSGRRLRHVFPSYPAAQAFMDRGPRRRATALRGSVLHIGACACPPKHANC